jgi:hypothetical protein
MKNLTLVIAVLCIASWASAQGNYSNTQQPAGQQPPPNAAGQQGAQPSTGQTGQAGAQGEAAPQGKRPPQAKSQD